MLPRHCRALVVDRRAAAAAAVAVVVVVVVVDGDGDDVDDGVDDVSSIDLREQTILERKEYHHIATSIGREHSDTFVERVVEDTSVGRLAPRQPFRIQRAHRTARRNPFRTELLHLNEIIGVNGKSEERHSALLC